MPDFAGFPRDTVAFLADLADHNDRNWFEANKARYETAWKDAAVGFCEAMAARLATTDPDVTVQPKVNGSIWRIHRDTRFSKDKTPYKTHLAVHFWYGASKKTGAAYYIGLEPDGSMKAGGGLYGMDKAMMERFREAVAGPKGAALADAVALAEAAGWERGGDTYVRVPKPYDADHPRADLLRHKGLYLMKPLVLGADLHTPAVLDAVAGAIADARPVVRWLQLEVAAG